MNPVREKTDAVHTVETDKATIRFSGGVVDDDSSSEEDEFCDSRSCMSDSKNDSTQHQNSSDSSRRDTMSKLNNNAQGSKQVNADSNPADAVNEKVVINHNLRERDKPQTKQYDESAIKTVTNSVSTPHRCDPADLSESRKNTLVSKRPVTSENSSVQQQYPSDMTGVDSSVTAGCTGYDTSSFKDKTSAGEEKVQPFTTNSQRPQPGHLSSMFQRFNPFNHSDLEEQDTFPQLTEAQLRAESNKKSK